MLLNLVMIAHIIQWRIMGKTVSPIEPSETMHTLQRGAINAGFIFFCPGDFGDADLRTFCLRLGLSHPRSPGFLRLAAEENGAAAEAVSIAAAGLCPAHRRSVHVCLAHGISILCQLRAGPLIPKFTNHLVTSNFWETFPSVAVAIPFLFICRLHDGLFPGAKGFCTYACPYGGFFGLADKLSPGKSA